MGKLEELSSGRALPLITAKTSTSGIICECTAGRNGSLLKRGGLNCTKISIRVTYSYVRSSSTLKLFRNYFIRKPPRKLMLFSKKKGLCCVRFLNNLFQTFLTRLQSPILSIILQYFIVKPLPTSQKSSKQRYRVTSHIYPKP